MIVCTPKGQCPISITFATVPWFNFQERFDFGPHFAFGLDNLARSPATLLFSRPCSGEDSLISAPVLPKLDGPHTPEGPPTAWDMAEVIHDQEFQQNASFDEQSSEISSSRTAIQLAHATIFLSSNNHLLYDQTDRFVKSIIDNKMYWVLKSILTPRTPTTEVLATNFLIVACQYNDVRTVSLLMSLGADPNVRKRFPEDSVTTTESMSPLSQAIRKGRLAVVEKLIEGGAKVNPAPVKASRREASWFDLDSLPLHPDDYLMEALTSPKTDQMVQLLVEKGAGVEKSPILAFAVDSGNIHLTTILLNAGAFNGSWKYPWAHGFRTCEKQKIKSYCATPLQIAAENNNLMMVHTLLNGDSNVNVPSGPFMEPHSIDYNIAEYCRTAYISPLVHAALNGNLEMIKILLNAGADIDFGPVYTKSNISMGRYQESVTSTALHAAAYQDNFELVQFLLGAGASVDTYQRGDTALQAAVKNNNIPLTELLLAYGANIYAPADWRFGRTALQAASENGNKALLQLLLAATTDVWSTSINEPPSPIHGRTAIQAAAGNGHIEMVRYLLEIGADINGPTAQGYGASTLQAAARSKNLDMIVLVLAAGAITSEPSGIGSALIIAIENNDLPIFELLLNHAVDICFDLAGNVYPVLRLAARHRSSIFLERLIGVGLDVNELWGNSLHGTALQRAVADGHLKAAQLLLVARTEAKTALDAAVPSACAVANWLSNALFGAVYRTCPVLVKLFLEYDADPNIVHPKEHATPLAFAISICYGFIRVFTHKEDEEEAEDVARYQKEEPVSKELRIVLLLLDSDADPNCRSAGHGYAESEITEISILGLAAQEGLIDVVKMLLNAGASPNWRYSVDDATALACAIFGGSNRIIDLLLEAGADINAPACPGYGCGTALQQAVGQNNLDCIRDLIHRGADVNALPAGVDGMTALQMAVRVENDEIVHLILDAGADINAPACLDGGRTALQEAASKGNLANVRMLLQKGADVNAPPSKNYGVTALQAASINGYLAVAMLLLHHGADINADASEMEGRTALQGAAEHGRLDIVHLLLENDHEMEGFYDRCEDAAEFADEEGHTTIARILREYRKDEGTGRTKHVDKKFERSVFGFRSRRLCFRTVCLFIIAIYEISSHSLNDSSPAPVLLCFPSFMCVL